MGLSDLTLEKLIGEINGYKQKMESLYEQYGHAAQDLQDRINVLGYSLNSHLKEVKEQISNTPQRLLNLETKYVSGEVNDQEYRTQREEFKGLLQRNLHTIDDVKSMITVLAQIEARPLGPSEIKLTSNPPQTTPAPLSAPSISERLYNFAVEERTPRAAYQERKQPAPYVVSPLPQQTQTPATIQASSAPAATAFPFEAQPRPEKTLADVSTPRWTPIPPTPMQPANPAPTLAITNENTQQAAEAKLPTQESLAAAETVVHSEPVSVTEPTVETPIVTPQPSLEDTQITEHLGEQTAPITSEEPATTEAEKIDPTPTGPLVEADSTTSAVEEPPATAIDELSTPNVSTDLAETLADTHVTEAEEALMVKVVEDIPILEGSASGPVVEGPAEAAQLQTPLFGPGGTDTISVPAVAPAADVAQVALSQPSPFYKVVCPKCGADVPKPAKVWELKGGKSKKNVLIGLFQCQDCRVKFREALTREII